MNKIEIVQVRLFDLKDGELVIDAFHRTLRNPPAFRARLYQSCTVENDWLIIFGESNTNDIKSKSTEAIFLIESLRQIGLVNHALWMLAQEEYDDGPDQL